MNPFLMLLSAADAKERQHWVSRLQICTQHHTEAMGKVRKHRVHFPKTHLMGQNNADGIDRICAGLWFQSV